MDTLWHLDNNNHRYTHDRDHPSDTMDTFFELNIINRIVFNFIAILSNRTIFLSIPEYF